MYTGFEIFPEDREALARRYPPKNATWLGHHITEKFGVPANQDPPPPPKSVVIVEYLEDEGIEGFLVEVNGSVHRPSGGKYHLTWSIDKTKGRRPADTNKIVDNGKRIERKIPLRVTPKTFTKSTEKALKEEINFLNFLKHSKHSS